MVHKWNSFSSISPLCSCSLAAFKLVRMGPDVWYAAYCILAAGVHVNDFRLARLHSGTLNPSSRGLMALFRLLPLHFVGPQSRAAPVRLSLHFHLASWMRFLLAPPIANQDLLASCNCLSSTHTRTGTEKRKGTFLCASAASVAAQLHLQFQVAWNHPKARVRLFAIFSPTSRWLASWRHQLATRLFSIIMAATSNGREFFSSICTCFSPQLSLLSGTKMAVEIRSSEPFHRNHHHIVDVIAVAVVHLQAWQ